MRNLLCPIIVVVPFFFFLRRDQYGLIEKGVVIYFFIEEVNCVDKFSWNFDEFFFFFFVDYS